MDFHNYLDGLKYFEFDAGNDDNIFITLNPIIIIEKMGEYQRL